MRERDTQRSRVYKADGKLIDVAKPLPEIRDVERFTKRINRKSLRDRYGAAVWVKSTPIYVKDGRGCRRAMACGNVITIPKWARNEAVVLHELAHVVHGRLLYLEFRGYSNQRGSRTKELAGGAAHGWQYAAIYLDLVRFVMGAEAGRVLKAAFKQYRVRYRPKRVLSPEQLERLRGYRQLAVAAKKQES